MRVLAVDTTGPEKSIACAVDGRLAGETAFSGDLETCFWDRLDAFLDSLGLSVADFDLYAANAGPGSWTGVRFGLAVVKGWAAATGKKVFVMTGPEIDRRSRPGIVRAGVLALGARVSDALDARRVAPRYGAEPRFRKLADT